MRKLELFISLIFLLLMSAFVSCTVSDDGDIGIASWFWVVLALLFVFFIVTIVKSNKEVSEANEKLAEKGLKMADFTKLGHFVGGHPDIDKDVRNVSVLPEENVLKFFDHLPPINMPKPIFDIEKNKISEIKVEDASTVEKNITLGRVFLVGIFALAWRKSKKNEFAFVSIEWNDGRFSHSTLFAFEGKDAFTEANKSRNSLIKMLR